MHGYQRFFAELKRRKVFRVMAVYGVVGFVLLQVMDLLVPALLLPDWTYRLVALFLFLGFPVAVLLAWAFEMTPEGVKRTEAAAPEEIDAIVAEPARRRWPAGLLALIGVAALFTGGWWVGRRTAAPADGAGPGVVRAASASEVLDVAYADLAADERPSVAVLPFVNMSPDEEQQYFADGMSEELLNALAKVRALRVAGRTSSFAYRNVEKDLREIGSELGVRYLVEGSVRKQGNRLRITAQLVDAEDNFHLWSESYDRTLDDVFAVQEEIAEAIAEALQVSLGVGDGDRLVAPTGDLEAYDLYLAAKARMRERGAGVREAVRLFEDVVARDSSWAPGWAGLAQAYSLIPFYEAGAGVGPVTAADWGPPLEEAERAAKRALALDPRVAGADVALGSVYRDRWDWKPAEAHLLRALEIDPDDVEAHQQYADLLAAMGRSDEALRSIRRAAALDPTSAIRQNNVGWILYQNGRVAESIPQLERASALDPGLKMPYQNLHSSYLALGRLEEAERYWRREFLRAQGYEETELREQDRRAEVRFAALRAGDRDAYAACCRMFGEPGDWLLVGDTAGAIRILRDRLLGNPGFNANELNLLWDPVVDPIRDAPSFRQAREEILAHAGLEGAQMHRAPAGE
jgi:TolB-like protein